MDQFETPLDQLRPVSARDNTMDASSVMDYNEIVSGIGGTAPPDHYEDRHLAPPPPQYSQTPPQIAHINDPAIQQALQLQQHQQQAVTKPKKTEVFEDSNFISDQDQKDFLYLIVAVALLFSEGSQQYLSTLIPSLFRDGKTSLVGLMFNALLLIIGLIFTRKVKVSM